MEPSALKNGVVETNNRNPCSPKLYKSNLVSARFHTTRKEISAIAITMKPMLLALSFLLSTSMITLFSEAAKASGNVLRDLKGAKASGNALRDLKGDELRAGTPYYIVSAIFPLGGGVSLDKVKNDTCPTDVTLLRNPFDNGIPVIFSTYDEENVITDSTPISISFDTKSSCAESTTWIVEEDESSTSASLFVTIGGAKDYRNAEFRLINEGGILTSNYKLQAFFVVRGFGYISDVGVDDSLFGARRLAMTEAPLLVSFRKVEDDINGLRNE
ncbi:unnamed protein product [Dovyalis caffra]|uniref:Uncharacterized protein n=1 Tax=Dovyalis caffra TaxID=77055 RepID=A0AAV1QPH1_9ROSI|nr:unnamed protein product [Dovyalis caffra]